MQDSITPAFIIDLQNSSSSSQENSKKTFDRETQISEKSQTIHHNEQGYTEKQKYGYREKQKLEIKQINKFIKQVNPEKIRITPKRDRLQDQERNYQSKNSIAYNQSDRKLLGSFEQEQEQQIREQDIEEIYVSQINNKKKRNYRKTSQPNRQYEQQEMIQKISNNSQEEYESSQDSDYYDQDQQFQPQPKQKKQLQAKLQNQKIKTQPSVKINFRKKPLFIEDHFDKVIAKALPIGYKIVCTITVQSRFLGFSSKYNLNLKQSDMKSQYRFLLSAKKEMMKINSNFIISKSYDVRGIHKRDSNYVGLLDANFTGTEFTLHPPNNQATLLAINYGKNIMGHNGVRDFIVVKPKVGLPETSENTLNNLVMRKQDNKIQKFQAAKPVKTKSGWKVDFKGKAKQASAKNFILKDKKQRETLLFAKQSNDTFLMEVSHPFSILEAFAICLSSLDSKLFCN